MKTNLMKSKKTAFCLLFPLIIQSGAAIASGTGVGSGTNGEREVTMAQLAEQLRIPAPASNRFAQSDLAQWCNQVIPVLQRQMRRSQNMLEMGDYGYSYHILIDALRVTLQSLDQSGQQVLPHTRKLVAQALLIGSALETLGNHPADLLVRRNLISNMIQSIITQIRDWDIQMYLPYQYHQTYGRCQVNCPPAFDIAAYNQSLLRIAAQTLDTVNQSLVVMTARSLRPLGSAGLATANYLKTIEVLSGLIAQDLHENLFEFQNACVIADLESLAFDLSSYNGGQAFDFYRNSARALTDTYERVQSVRNRLLQNAEACRR